MKCSKPVFWKKKRKKERKKERKKNIINLSSVDYAQRMVGVKIQIQKSGYFLFVGIFTN